MMAFEMLVDQLRVHEFGCWRSAKYLVVEFSVVHELVAYDDVDSAQEAD